MTGEEDHGFEQLTTMHVRRAVGGSPASVSWVVERFTPLLIAQARYRTGGDLGRMCDPEDIVQDVWLRVLPRLGELTPEQRFTPTLVSYLSRAVLHQVNNTLRLMLRRRMRGGLAPGAVPSEQMDRADDCTAIVSKIVRKEGQDAVLQAIEGLPKADREVLVLRAIEQHPNPVAASILGVEPGTLAVRYHRAIKRLRDRLQGSVFDELGD